MKKLIKKAYVRDTIWCTITEKTNEVHVFSWCPAEGLRG